jgi:hypothetical protein
VVFVHLDIVRQHYAEHYLDKDYLDRFYLLEAVNRLGMSVVLDNFHQHFAEHYLDKDRFHLKVAVNRLGMLVVQLFHTFLQ